MRLWAGYFVLFVRTCGQSVKGMEHVATHKMWGLSGLSEELLASGEGPCCTEFLLEIHTGILADILCPCRFVLYVPENRQH